VSIKSKNFLTSRMSVIFLRKVLQHGIRWLVNEMSHSCYSKCVLGGWVSAFVVQYSAECHSLTGQFVLNSGA
jgi:hypothetical protein